VYDNFTTYFNSIYILNLDNIYYNKIYLYLIIQMILILRRDNVLYEKHIDEYKNYIVRLKKIVDKTYANNLIVHYALNL
jgi:hypothetical protein